jgi:hypothetical protein
LRGNKIAENQEEIPGFRAEIAPVWALKTPDFAGFRRRNWLQKAIPAPAPAPACRNFRPPKRAENRGDILTMERAEKISALDEVVGTFLAEHPKAPVPKGYKRSSGKHIKEAGRAAQTSINSVPTTPATTATATTNNQPTNSKHAEESPNTPS